MKNIMLIVRMMRDNNGVPNWISGSCNHRLLILETWFLLATLTTRPAQPFSTPRISRSLSIFCMLEEMEKISNACQIVSQVDFVQGDWSSQFKAEETALGNFYVKRDQIKMVNFMNQA